MNLTTGRLKLFLLISSASSAKNIDGNERDNIYSVAAADGIYPQASPAEVNDPRMLAKSSKKKKKHKSSKKRGKRHKARKQNNNDDDRGGIFGPVATSCTATIGQSKIGFNAGRNQMLKPIPSWQTLAQQYSTCSASTLTSLKFFDIPDWSGDLSMSDMDDILTANPNVETVIVAVPQNKLGKAFTTTNATQVVTKMNELSTRSWTPRRSIKFILAVGNEPVGYCLGNEPIKDCLENVLDAMVLLQKAIQKAMGTATIPMSTPLSANAFNTTFPPNNSTFRDWVTMTNMKQILDIVYQSRGPFMINRYPYFDLKNNSEIELDCALGVKCTAFPSAQSQFQIDILATRFAVKNLYGSGAAEYIYFSNKDNFYATETGWPSNGTSWGRVPPITSNTNLITYNKNAIRDVETGGLKDVVGKVFLFEAHDEGNKTDEQCNGCQNCFGLMYENGTSKN